ncbi:MAG: hypothetical protein V4611_04205 [Patescibacteria group bacterium]
MNKGTSTLEYSFGTITVEIKVKGETVQPQQVIDHMLSAATAVLSADALHLGISQQRRGEEGALTQKCEATVQVGKLRVSVQINFNLTQRVPKRTINNIVFLDALPIIWQTAGFYFGDADTSVATQSPLKNGERSRIIQHLEAALALDSGEYDQQRSQEERQPMSYAGSRD